MPLLLLSVLLAADPPAPPLPPGCTQLGDTRLAHDGQIYQVAFAPDGKTLISGGTDRTVRVWEAASAGSCAASTA